MKLWAQDKVYEPYFQFEGDNLLMLCDTEGATIYYVIEPYSADMSEDEAYTFAESLQVNDQSAVYSNPIPISENVIIKAVAVKQGMASSDPSTLIYNYLAWKDLEKAILYGSDVLSRAQDNPNVDQSLKEDLQWRIEEGEHFYYERAWMDSHEAEHFSQEIMDIARQIEEQMGGGTTTAEPYAVLSDNNTVLTFYYDEKKAERNGMGIESNREWREYAEDITTVNFDPSFSSCRPTSTSFWFFGFTNLTSVVGIENLNTSNVSNMAQMFTSCSSLTNLDVSRFNTVNVTNMAAMFADCRNLTSIDVRGFNTAKVTDMEAMFENCLSLTNLDLSHFDTHNVTDMVQMFFGCSALTTLDVSNFNTENVKAFYLMFAACRSLTSLDVSSFNTASATEIDRMFSQCTGLTTLDLHNFDTDNVTNMSDMFFECSNLKSINISNFFTSKVANFNSMFSGCSNLASIQAGSANIPAEEYARIGNPNLLVYVNEPSLAPQGIQNVVVNGQAQEIVLTDAATGNNNWYCPQAFTAERIRYTRNFGQQTEVGVSRGWESIALPFTVQEITHESKGQITPFGANGTKHFWLRGYSPDGLYSAATLEANKPYVISMPNNTVVYPDAYNLNGRVTFSASNTTVPATPPLEEMMVVRDNIIMMPTFQYIPQNEYVYAVNVGQARERYAEGSVFARDLRDVRPFEAYTTHGERNGARPNFIRIAAQPSNESVGIRDIKTDSAEDAWYSIDGRKLQGEPQRKGVYIQKGKKIRVK